MIGSKTDQPDEQVPTHPDEVLEAHERMLGTSPGLLNRLQGVRAIAVDRPGFGLSEPAHVPRERLRDAAIEFLDEVVDELGLETYPLAGNSMGGTWAIWYALARPERVSGIVLLGSAPLPRVPTCVPCATGGTAAADSPDAGAMGRPRPGRWSRGRAGGRKAHPQGAARAAPCGARPIPWQPGAGVRTPLRVRPLGRRSMSFPSAQGRAHEFQVGAHVLGAAGGFHHHG